MLISKGATVGETVSIKLISGEEIIARLDEDTLEFVKVHRPLLVSLGPQGLGMIPFVFLSGSDTMKIKHDHIITMNSAKKDASDQYIQGTTGIALK